MTYCDHIDFPLTSWSDLSEWPHLDSIASRGANIIGVSMESKVEPGDIETKEAFEAFKNKFVQQNCHRDVEIRTWVTSEIAEMGSEQSLFITTKSKVECLEKFINIRFSNHVFVTRHKHHLYSTLDFISSCPSAVWAVH